MKKKTILVDKIEKVNEASIESNHIRTKSMLHHGSKLINQYLIENIICTSDKDKSFTEQKKESSINQLIEWVGFFQNIWGLVPRLVD